MAERNIVSLEERRELNKQALETRLDHVTQFLEDFDKSLQTAFATEYKILNETNSLLNECEAEAAWNGDRYLQWLQKRRLRDKLARQKPEERENVIDLQTGKPLHEFAQHDEASFGTREERTLFGKYLAWEDRWVDAIEAIFAARNELIKSIEQNLDMIPDEGRGRMLRTMLIAREQLLKSRPALFLDSEAQPMDAIARKNFLRKFQEYIRDNGIRET